MTYYAQVVKSLPALWETWVQSLCQKEPLEKEMATHSSGLAWKIPWTEGPGELQSLELQRAGQDSATKTYISKHVSINHSVMCDSL